jgi:hypothetical protein
MTAPPDPGDEVDAIDAARSATLADVGSPDYLAVTLITATGETRFALARRDKVGDLTARYDDSCPDAPHEADGLLPLEYLRRITTNRRRETP